MKLKNDLIRGNNEKLLATHKKNYEFISRSIGNVDEIIKKLTDFQIAIPSWALGTGGYQVWKICGRWRTGFPGRKNCRCGIASCIKPVKRGHLFTYSLGYTGRCGKNKITGSFLRIDIRCRKLQYIPGSARATA